MTNPTENELDTRTADADARGKALMDESFMANYADLFAEDDGAAIAEAEKSVVKSDNSPGHEAPEALQGGSEETPTGTDKDAEFIRTQFSLVGLEPAAFKGKSEGELELAVANALSTLQRKKDAGFQKWREAQAQGKSEDIISGQGHQEAGRGLTQAAAPQAETTDSAIDLETALTPVFEDLSEEAAQSLKSVLGSLVSQNAALTARLDQEEQARQLAPIEKAVDEAVAGQVDLSNPEARAKFEAFAKAKADLDGLSPNAGESAADYIRRVVQNALPANGEQAQSVGRSSKQRPSTPAATGMEPSSKTTSEAFAESFDRHINSPEFRDLVS